MNLKGTSMDHLISGHPLKKAGDLRLALCFGLHSVICILIMFEKVAAIEKDHEHQFMKKFVDLKKRLQGEKGDAPAAAPVQEKPRQTREVSAYRCVFCGAVFEEHAVVYPVCKAIGAFQDCVIEKEV